MNSVKMWMIEMDGQAVPSWIYRQGEKKLAQNLADYMIRRNPQSKFRVVPVVVTWGGKGKGKR